MNSIANIGLPGCGDEFWTFMCKEILSLEDELIDN
jgi:hypothetical protein